MKKIKIDYLRVLAILTLLFSIIYFYLYLFAPSSIPNLLLLGVPNNQENILVIGSDFMFDAETKSFKEDDFGNSDTLILAGINPFKRKVNLVSIPRDTYVYIRGYGDKKINAAYLIGGPNFSSQVISDNFGVKTTGYVSLNLNAISQIVDALGGIEVEVDRDMYYRDKRGGVFINLKEGKQILTGKQAADFLRFRLDALGDVARIRRQQRFLKTLVTQMIKPKSITKAPQFLPIIKSSTKSNLSPIKLVKLANLVRTMQPADITFQTLPGTFAETEDKLSIWQINTAEAELLFENLF